MCRKSITWHIIAVLFAVLPVLLQRQVEHGVLRFPSHLFDYVQKFWQAFLDPLVVQRRVGLQQHQTLTPSSAREKVFQDKKNDYILKQIIQNLISNQYSN